MRRSRKSIPSPAKRGRGLGEGTHTNRDIDFSLLKSARVPAGVYSSDDFEALVDFVLTAEKISGSATMTLELTGHKRIWALNRRFRGVDRTTDVISFRSEKPPRLSGDIAINVAQATLQAKRMKHSVMRELRLLWIHGLLHLLDYTDYETVPRRRMFKRQNQLLRRWERLHTKPLKK